MLCSVRCCVSSCVAFLVFPRTGFGWYHVKVFTAARLGFIRIGRCRWHHPQISAYVGAILNTTSKHTSGGVLSECNPKPIKIYV